MRGGEVFNAEGGDSASEIDENTPIEVLRTLAPEVSNIAGERSRSNTAAQHLFRGSEVVDILDGTLRSDPTDCPRTDQGPVSRRWRAGRAWLPFENPDPISHGPDCFGDLGPVGPVVRREPLVQRRTHGETVQWLSGGKGPGSITVTGWIIDVPIERTPL